MTNAHEAMEDYLARLDDALRELHEAERAELLAEVRAHLEEAASRSSDPQAGVEAAIRSLGDPSELAQRLREGDDDRAAPERAKRILGMPYNFGPLSSEQVANRVWNPSDPRIFMPRVFGVGWTLNFGAIAVRLGLVRPDDEEPVPFANVPARALAAGLALLTAADVATLAVAVLLRHPPRPMPVHWGLVGPDRFASPLAAALSFLGPAVALNVLALWRFLRGASRTERALWLGALAFALVLLDGIYANGLVWAFTGHLLVFGEAPVLAGLAPVLGGLALAFAVLVLYSRLGVRAEWRRAHIR